MIKLFIIAILIINSIFWGFYPVSIISPHQRLLNKTGLTHNTGIFFHFSIGLFFYLIAFLVSHNFIS